MKTLFFILLLVISTAFASDREQAAQIIASLSSQSGLLSKMDAASARFIGLPYGAGGPLGEGETGRYDQDPLYRFDTFDCTTYVETIISLALSLDVDEFEQQMDKIRYENSRVDYLSRNHFPSLQWIPNNIENGLLMEVNDLVLPRSSQLIAEAVINIPGWLKKIKIEEIRVPNASSEEKQSLLNELQALSSQYEPKTAKLNYLPISTILKSPSLLKKIPSGSVINFVRPNWDLTDSIGTHMNISHQGLVFQLKGKTILRHASVGAEKRVIEIELIEYLKKFDNHPTLRGIHLMKLQGL
jgi:hypothetical protein